MTYTIQASKVYSHPAEEVLQAVRGAADGLEGKIIRQDETSGRFDVQFNKTILGKVLGERTRMEITVSAISQNTCGLALSAYPLDAIGRKLLFGARKGVTQKVMDWFLAHLEHNLQA